MLYLILNKNERSKRFCAWDSRPPVYLIAIYKEFAETKNTIREIDNQLHEKQSE